MKLQAFDPQAARSALRVLEYNPYHGKDGRFTGKSGSASTVAYPGRPSLGNRKDATAAEVAYRKTQSGWGSPALRQDNRAGRLDNPHYKAAGAFMHARKTRKGVADGFHHPANVKLSRDQAMRARAKAAGTPTRPSPEHRERVEQDPKKYTRRGSSGKRPEYVSPRGSTPPLLSQDLLAKRRAGGAAWGHHRKAEDARQTLAARKFAKHYPGGGRERVPQDPKKFTRGMSNGKAPATRDPRPFANPLTHPGQSGSVRADAIARSKSPDKVRSESRMADMAAARDPMMPAHVRSSLKDRYLSRGRSPDSRKAAPAPDRQAVPQNPSKYTRPTTSGKAPKQFSGKGSHERIRQAADAHRWTQDERARGGSVVNGFMAQDLRRHRPERAERAEVAQRGMAFHRQMHKAGRISRSARIERSKEVRRSAYEPGRR